MNPRQDSQSEAEEEKNDLQQSSVEEEEDDSGEDLINENMAHDYRPIPELDRYEQEGINDDDDENEPMNLEQRRRAEQEIDRRRGRLQDRRIHIPEALRDLSENNDEIRQEEIEIDNREYYQFDESDHDHDSEALDEERYINIEECRGKLQVWITEERTQNWIRRTFKRFLTSFKKGNQFLYIQKIKDMCQANKQSLEISFVDLVNFNSTIALWVAEEPKIILSRLNQIAQSQVLRLYNNYNNMHSEIFVRIVQLPIIDIIRDLRFKHMDKLIRVQGVITRRSAVYQQLKSIEYICQKCGQRKGPFYLENNDKMQPGVCINCQSQGPYKVSRDNLVYRNFQRLTLQESPGNVPAGRVPRQKEVIVVADQIDQARPGDEVEVTGVYTSRYDYALNIKHGFPLYYTIIEANHVRRKEESQSFDLDKITIDQIIALSKDPSIEKRIINSVAPGIYGHETVKMALALAMFGGVTKDVQKKHRIRGDINVLILGDPGTAKSQFLKNVEKTFYRSVYTTGKGASAVGLTASVRRDYQSNEWSLEGGALVLADRGICLIDEFDKMNENDRTSIHEAMEQQSISISKAGIVTTLQARCSVIAAANPIGGKYDSQIAFHDNVDLTDPILSRFDILCVVKDLVQKTSDDALAAFVINSHMKNHPKAVETYLNGEEEQKMALINQLLEEPARVRDALIQQDLFRKYILYARERVKPKLNDIDQDQIVKFYTQLRKEAEVCGGIHIATRHLESIIRMSEAHARMFLRETVTNHDISVAMSVMLESFIQSQKFAVGRQLRKKFQSYFTYREDTYRLLMQLLDQQFKQSKAYHLKMWDQNQSQIKVAIEFIIQDAKKYNVEVDQDFFNQDMFTKRYYCDNNYIFEKLDF